MDTEMIGHRLPANERGLGMIEILMVISLIGILAAIAMPNLNRSQLNGATQNLAADLRVARAQATGRGAHFMVTLGTTSYSLQRLEEDEDGVWTPIGDTLQEVNLPPGVEIYQGVGEQIEFNTRGLLTLLPDGTPAEVITIQLQDARSAMKKLEVWPSGQVLEVEV